ncbi:hypothetical protein [Streptomyces sp. NPDC053560]|uniref:hypothetical protein n=1 Tax=Streptomyces sp. NPDC053560 TaxID=3365711 RepID=UPI0037CFB523
MSAAHLHAVPDPDEDGAPDEVPVPAPVAPVPVVDDEDQVPEDEYDQEEADGEELHPARALAMPNLRPYVDLRPLAELGPLAVEAGRRNGPALLRGLVEFLCVLGRGLAVLVALAVGWLSGSIGKSGSIAARFAGAGFTVYGVVRLSMKYPDYAPWAIGGPLFLAMMLAGEGRITAPGSTPRKAGKQQKEGEEQQEGEEPQEQPCEEQPQKTRGGLFGRFRKAAKYPAVDLSKQPATAADTAGGEVAPAVPDEPPLTNLLRKEIGEENGVHLVDLRPAMREHLPGLSSATDEELRQALIAGGFDPSRKFRARGVAGRAGVHRTQLPPLPSPGSGPGAFSAPLSAPGELPRPADSPEAESGGESGGEPNGRGYSIVRDPERGPSAWRIQHHGGDRNG